MRDCIYDQHVIGTVSRDFWLQVFFMNHLPFSHWMFLSIISNILGNSRNIFAVQGALPVSKTQLLNRENVSTYVFFRHYWAPVYIHIQIYFYYMSNLRCRQSEIVVIDDRWCYWHFGGKYVIGGIVANGGKFDAGCEYFRTFSRRKNLSGSNGTIWAWG